MHIPNDKATKYFSGASSQRQVRAIQALIANEGVSRENLDSIAGCSNSPELMATLGRKGLDFGCRMVNTLDRDGRRVRYGVYYLTDLGRRQIEGTKPPKNGRG